MHQKIWLLQRLKSDDNAEPQQRWRIHQHRKMNEQKSFFLYSKKKEHPCLFLFLN
jgi:hypothetical protein